MKPPCTIVERFEPRSGECVTHCSSVTTLPTCRATAGVATGVRPEDFYHFCNYAISRKGGGDRFRGLLFVRNRSPERAGVRPLFGCRKGRGGDDRGSI
jgi:hypothetical protein